MRPLERVKMAADSLRVFPLPSAVLLPGAALPLHIFEGRYRELLKDALAGDRVIALADLEPGWESDYGGRPPMRPIACAGLVVWDEVLPDGRANIVLHGVARVRIVEELPPNHAYREVRAEVLDDPPYHGPLEEQLGQAVLEIAGRIEDAAAQNLVQLAARARGGALADIVAATVVQDLERRRALLAQLDPAARLQAALDDVGEIIARLGPASPGGPLN
jgi:uncharacterized protein